MRDLVTNGLGRAGVGAWWCDLVMIEMKASMFESSKKYELLICVIQ